MVHLIYPPILRMACLLESYKADGLQSWDPQLLFTSCARVTGTIDDLEQFNSLPDGLIFMKACKNVATNGTKMHVAQCEICTRL